ncbi:MAG: insulinase family protein, partial [Gemmatimonadales bacterium]
GRKLLYDGGTFVKSFLADLAAFPDELPDSLSSIGSHLRDAVEQLQRVTDWIFEHREQPNDVFAGATPYLRIFATVVGGWLLATGAKAAREQLDAGAGDDFFTLSSTVLTDHADLALGLAADVLLNATFPAEELELARRRSLSGLRIERSQPGAVAARFFNRELYGDHPYGQAPTETTVQAITREAVQQFAREHLRPQGGWLVVAGAISLNDARALAERHLGTWSGRAPARAYGRPPAPRATDILLVHRPGSQQSNILIGNLAMRPGDQQYYAATVANKILGGGTDARLFQILREERGWTYGSYSSFNRPFDVGRFQATAEVRTPVTDSALAEMLHQVRRIRTERVPDSTLESAKGFLTGVFPLTIETPQQVAGQVAVQERLGLGQDYLRRYRERIAAVTPPQLMAAARATVRPDSAVIVVVGDGAVIFEGLRAIASVRIVDVEGNSLTPDDLAPSAATDLNVDAARMHTGRDSLNVTFQGQAIGAMISETTVDEETVRYSTTLMIPMMGMNAGNAGVLQRATFRPVETTSRLAMGGGAAVEGTLRFDGMRVHGQAMGAPAGPGAPPALRDVDTTFALALYDSDQIAATLTALPLAVGTSYTFPTFGADHATISTYTARVERRESVTVPAGTFDVWRVGVAGEEASTVWITADAPHRLVRMELASQPIAFELVR